MSALLLLLLSTAFGGELRVSVAGPVRVQLDGKVVPVDARGVVEIPELIEGLHEVVIVDQLGKPLSRETYAIRYQERLRLGYIDDTLLVVGREKAVPRPGGGAHHDDDRPHHPPPPAPPAPPPAPTFGSFEMAGAPAEEYRVVLDGQQLAFVGDGSWLAVNQPAGALPLQISRGDAVILSGTIDIVGGHHQRCVLATARRYTMSCDASGAAQTFVGGAVPEEPVVEEEATVSPMNDTDFRVYVNQVSQASSSSARLRILQSTAPNMAFTVPQADALVQLMYSDTNRAGAVKVLADRIVLLDVEGMARIVKSMSSDSSRVEAVRLLAPYCIDPQNAFKLGGAFYSDSARTEAIELVAAQARR